MEDREVKLKQCLWEWDGWKKSEKSLSWLVLGISGGIEKREIALAK